MTASKQQCSIEELEELVQRRAPNCYVKGNVPDDTKCILYHRQLGKLCVEDKNWLMYQRLSSPEWPQDYTRLMNRANSGFTRHNIDKELACVGKNMTA